MTKQRKQIIVNEIAFWKQNKMLPDHYCDFLTSLYTGGMAESPEQIVDAKQSILAKERKTVIRKFIFFPILAIILLVGLQYVPIDWLSIAVGGIVGLILSIVGIRFAMKKHLAAPLLHVSGALLLLSMSVQIATTYFAGSNLVLYIVLCINCAFWAILGLWQKLVYFMIAGGLGFAVVVGYGLLFV